MILFERAGVAARGAGADFVVACSSTNGLPTDGNSNLSSFGRTSYIAIIREYAFLRTNPSSKLSFAAVLARVTDIVL